MNINILRFETVDSTNSEAARQARLGAPEGTCVIAEHQTAGRGRYGRHWISAAGAGLYFSIVLRPRLRMAEMPLITLMAGVAVHETLVRIGLLRPDIKWVNDVLIADKKISGILSETLDTAAGPAVIVGIGVNLRSAELPTATSVEAELGKAPAVDDLAEALTTNLTYFYRMLGGESGPSLILEQWQQRSSYFSGKSVRVVVANEVLEGITDGLEQNGALRLKLPNGGIRILQAGEVERLRQTPD